jgi:catechol 2,3-dioxygenase
MHSNSTVNVHNQTAPDRLPATTSISYAHLRVSDLGHLLEFYRDALGLQESVKHDSTVGLGTTKNSSPLVFLTENKDGVLRPRRSTGLFHVAIRFPSRKELAGIFQRLSKRRYPFQGFADHGVSEALYLADPEGNGIELYCDRPRAEWKFENGSIAMGTWELDLDNLLSELSGDDRKGIHPQTDIGHIHLNVSDLTAAENFYHGLLGFDITARNYPGALFASAGGYHHHVGLNTWAGQGAPQPPPDTLGLIKYGIVIPDDTAKQKLKETMLQSGIQVEEQNARLFVKDQDGIQIEIQ